MHNFAKVSFIELSSKNIYLKVKLNFQQNFQRILFKQKKKSLTKANQVSGIRLPFKIFCLEITYGNSLFL